MKKFISEGGQFSSTESELATPSFSKEITTPRSVVVASNITPEILFAKIVDIGSEINKKIDCIENKFLNQFDNLTSRLNALEVSVRAFNKKSSAALAADSDLKRILKGNPVWSTKTDFEDFLVILNDPDVERKCVKELLKLEELPLKHVFLA